MTNRIKCVEPIRLWWWSVGIELLVFREKTNLYVLFLQTKLPHELSTQLRWGFQLKKKTCEWTWRFTKFTRVNFKIANAYGNLVSHKLRIDVRMNIHLLFFSSFLPPLIVLALLLIFEETQCVSSNRFK